MEDIKNDITYQGTLYINPEAGTATFMTGEGAVILRVTHLPTPVPAQVNIDMVAINQVTSYTPLTNQEVDGWFDSDEEAQRSGDERRDDGPPSRITRRSRGTGDMKKGQWLWLTPAARAPWTQSRR